MKICLIGCGKMGSSLLEGWSSLKVIKHITIIEPNLDEIPSKLLNIKSFNFYKTIEEAENFSFDMTILAVKPQVMEVVLKQISNLNFISDSWLSIAAGLTVKFFENVLGNNQQIIRTIPNTPASIKKGVTAIYFNTNCINKTISESILLMKAAGETIIVNDENLMDAYTAVSGSGPAYIFYFVEAIISAAKEMGINEKNARILAEKTLIGSAYLLENSQARAQDLRKAVTSPKGTTEAGLNVLMKKDAFFNLTSRAIQKAQKRGRELGKS